MAFGGWLTGPRTATSSRIAYWSATAAQPVSNALELGLDLLGSEQSYRPSFEASEDSLQRRSCSCLGLALHWRGPKSPSQCRRSLRLSDSFRSCTLGIHQILHSLSGSLILGRTEDWISQLNC